MTKSDEESNIKRCLTIIEERLMWGESSAWTNYDFEKLTDAFYDGTGVRLSVTTLKRIWGKLKYESAPTLTTLNALAKFAGYTDWRDFKQKNKTEPGTDVPESPRVENLRVPRRQNFRRYWLILVLPVLAAMYFFISSYSSEEKPLNPSDFAFKADKMITEGVPNSVVFHYDARAAKTDSIFIVQTWDTRRKKLVQKINHEHSAIYYHPGFFRTKLIADGQVVKTHDLWITSGGWLCLTDNEPAPIYFRKEEYQKEDRIEVDEKTLSSYNLSLHPKAPLIRFYNQRDLGNIMTDNFIFETTLKSDFNAGAGACQNTQVMIHGKEDMIVIPLGAKACVGDMFLYFAGKQVASTDADLSGFGTDLTEWTTLRIETVNKVATIYVNNKNVYSLTFPNDPSEIVGLQYVFNGVGAVKNTTIRNSTNNFNMDLE